jgi:MFS family permease
VLVWFFTAFWTIIALQLSERYQLGAETAGLFGIAGVVGILFAPIAGKIGDRRGPAHVIAVGTLIVLTSWCTFAASATVAGLIVGVILLDFGEQGALVSNQQVIHALRPEARSRLNTIFMGGMFVGGAIGFRRSGSRLAYGRLVRSLRSRRRFGRDRPDAGSGERSTGWPLRKRRRSLAEAQLQLGFGCRHESASPMPGTL